MSCLKSKTVSAVKNRGTRYSNIVCAPCNSSFPSAKADSRFNLGPIITFLREQIRTTGDGPDINPSNVRCRRCPPNWRQHGGFDSNYGILLCANNLRTRSKVEDSLAHEMIHAYDHVRFKVDPQNLRHQACTEIRASTLSGECRFMREFWSRGQYKFNQGMQDCVKRRATLSMMNRPGVKDDVQAAKLVNEVWDSCFVDTRPFDEVYR